MRSWNINFNPKRINQCALRIQYTLCTQRLKLNILMTERKFWRVYQPLRANFLVSNVFGYCKDEYWLSSQQNYPKSDITKTDKGTVKMLSLTDNRKIGILLAALGLLFLLLGVLLLFDTGLLAIGNVLFISSIPFLVGFRQVTSCVSLRQQKP